MLISHKYKFIFFKSVKTASTSTFAFFTPYCLPENLKAEYDFKKRPLDKHLGIFKEGIIGRKNANQKIGEHPRHVKPKYVKEMLDKIDSNIWKTYFKFVNIRNPWDMTVSRYFFYKNYVWPNKKFDFQKFVQDLYESQYVIGNEKATSRDMYTLNKEYICDFHIRYESLKEDIKKVCENLQIKEFNVKTLQNFNSEFRENKKNYKEMYNEKTKKLVEKMYIKDIEKFEYGF